MAKRILFLLLLMTLTSLEAAAQEIKPPTLAPSPQLDKHRDLMREGVALHDRGQYEAAINTYQQILKENPDDVDAMYEMGFSYFAAGDYKKSLDIANKGAQYKSNLLSAFYTLIGNNLDHIGQSEKAIKTYKQGIALFPQNVQLHYNLAVALVGARKPDEAKKSFKDALRDAPEHPSSHLGLSQLYQQENYRIPALLAACRFLVLEPNSSRSRPVLQMVNEILQGGAQKGRDPGNITILIDPAAKTDEGDFNTLMTAMSIFAAARHLKDNEDKSEVRLLIDQLSLLLSTMSESTAKQKSSGFAWDYYRPYFVEISNRKFVEPFCYYISQSAQSQEVERWLMLNAERVREFLNWSKTYQWTR